MLGRRRWRGGKFGRVRNPCSKVQCKGSEPKIGENQLARSEELSVDFRGSSDLSQPTDEITDGGEARNDCWSIEGSYILSSSRRTSSSALRAEGRNISNSADIH